MKTYSPFRLSALILLLLAAGCGKKTPIIPPPPPTSNNNTTPTNTAGPERPTVASFTAEPASIERGQSALLRWSVTGAAAISINNGIGTVPATGTQNITPTETTTWTLAAASPAGTTSATATVTVRPPAPPPPPPPANNTGRTGTLESRLQSDLQDALFDYDSGDIRGDARAALTSDATALRQIFADFPSASINVEGHCDERGSAEYNLGLGDRRASAARDFLVQLGVPAARLHTISYGKERPVCTESDESCWQRNRRAHFSSGQ